MSVSRDDMEFGRLRVLSRLANDCGDVLTRLNREPVDLQVLKGQVIELTTVVQELCDDLKHHV
jgi:hypothetical protein